MQHVKIIAVAQMAYMLYRHSTKNGLTWVLMGNRRGGGGEQKLLSTYCILREKFIYYILQFTSFVYNIEYVKFIYNIDFSMYN